jgi:hypothetical protein
MTRNMDKRIERVEAAVASKAERRVIFVHWADFDKNASCVVRSGKRIFEQRPSESNESFTDRVSSILAVEEEGGTELVWIENLFTPADSRESAEGIPAAEPGGEAGRWAGF